MQELVEWTQQRLSEKELHPLLIIGHFVVEFLKIHPFEDGNGRLSRVLTNLLLLQHGYSYVPYVSHEKLIEDHKPEYYLALRKTQNTLGTDQEDITPWIEFFLRIFLSQSQAAVALLDQEDLERLLSLKQLAVWQYLQSVSEATPGDIAKHTNVVRITVNQALTKLLHLKRIERLGMARGTRYRLLTK
jgi:Fic family protein